MTVETVVDPMLTHNTAMNANALILMEVAEEERILLHLLLQFLQSILIILIAPMLDGLGMDIVMM